MMSRLFLKSFKSFVFILGLWLSGGFSVAQNFHVANIPDTIKANANAVILNDEARFQIFNLNKTILYRRTVVTIFNPDGSSFGIKGINYDKSSSIRSFSANLYNSEGELSESLKKSEFLDRSNISEVSLFEDNRVRIADLRKKSYPYTVEFEYEVEYKNLFFTPSWIVQQDEKIGVLKSSFEITGPADLIPYYRVQNAEKPVEKYINNEHSLKWEFLNLTPVQFEPFGTDIAYYTPVIDTTPRKFEYGGYPGNFNSWENFGQWISTLNEGRDILPEHTQIKIKELVSDTDVKREKVKRIYDYLQQNTRYVSVQLGIGGYQPIEASTVDKLGYGDCKALSNYTKAMLKAAGIESLYVLVEAGQYPSLLSREFANNTFNHAILAVPMEKDTIWLECTSQTNPFGYLGKFTSDREVLLVTERGGVVVKTPAYSMKDNQQITVANVEIDESGNAKAVMNILYSGIQHENGDLDYWLRQGTDAQEKWIYKNSDISSFNLIDFEFRLMKGDMPKVVQNTSMQIQKLASISGKRLFLRPNLNNKNTYIPDALEKRRTPIVKPYSYYDKDSITYTLPQGYAPEHIPEPISLTSPFGEYSCKITVSGDKLTYNRILLMKKGTFSKESYSQFVEFYKQIARADKQKVVLINKT